jgi:methylthioribose-1-phosphate isomerase
MKVKVYSPAFDVTPAGYVTALICDKGITYPKKQRPAQVKEKPEPVLQTDLPI